MKPKPGVEYLIFAPVEVLEDDPGRVLTDHHGQELRVPDREEARPDRALLEIRWEKALEG